MTPSVCLPSSRSAGSGLFAALHCTAPRHRLNHAVALAHNKPAWPLQTIRPQHAARHYTRADPATTAAVPASRIREGDGRPDIPQYHTPHHRRASWDNYPTNQYHRARPLMPPIGQRQEHRQKPGATPSLSRPRSLTRPGPPATASRWLTNEMTPHIRTSSTPKLTIQDENPQKEKSRFTSQMSLYSRQLRQLQISRRAAKTITVAKLRKQRKKPTAFLPRIRQGSQVKPARLPRNPTSANRDVPKRLTSHPSARPPRGIYSR